MTAALSIADTRLVGALCAPECMVEVRALGAVDHGKALADAPAALAFWREHGRLCNVLSKRFRRAGAPPGAPLRGIAVYLIRQTH